MALIINLNKITEQLLYEVDNLDVLEKQSVLAYVRALKLKREKRKPVANPGKDVKPLTMIEIDEIKHKVGKQYAGK